MRIVNSVTGENARTFAESGQAVEERLRLTARTSGIASVWAVDAICFSRFFSGDSQKQGGISSNRG